MIQSFEQITKHPFPAFSWIQAWSPKGIKITFLEQIIFNIVKIFFVIFLITKKCIERERKIMFYLVKKGVKGCTSRRVNLDLKVKTRVIVELGISIQNKSKSTFAPL